MIFSSLQYLIFLPIAVFLYWRTSGGVRLALVIAASYFFYMSWLPVYGLLLFAMTLVNWLLGLALGWAQGKTKTWSRAILGLGLLVNLGALCYYKYTNFFLSSLADAFNWTGSHLGFLLGTVPAWDVPVLNILLPLGISFFVFEFLHYLIDIYRGDKPVKGWMEFAAFASFFPSQIAGPIKRYQDFLGRLRQPEALSAPLFNEAMALIVRGLFKKVAIADPMGLVIMSGFAASGPLSLADSLICSIGFVIQVFCDFSGYTDIGRGSALLMGIRLPENFQLPLIAHDLADFWRRWHMSLSFWLRDYVYISLGGSRDGRLGTWRNLFITMVACGLWHGAAWHYVIFGVIQGAGMIINREWTIAVSSMRALKAVGNTWLGVAIGWAVTMTFTVMTWTLFRAPDCTHALYVWAGLLNPSGASTLVLPLVKSGVLTLIAVYAGFWLVLEALKKWNFSLPVWSADAGFAAPVRAAAWSAAVILMLAAKPSEATPFVYFQF